MPQSHVRIGLLPGAPLALTVAATVVVAGISHGIFGGSSNFRAQTGGGPCIPTITEYAIPTTDSAPFGIAAGPDGNIWFTEVNVNKIGRITPSGVITEYDIPTADSYPREIVAGPDGNLWFTVDAEYKIGRITPSGVITEYDVPTADSYPYTITAGPDGNLWFARDNKIGRITPSGVITEYDIPTADSYPYTITAGPDGNLWFTEFRANKIGRITPSGVITEYDVPTADSYPYTITAGPDGNVWFTVHESDKIGRITPSGTVTEYPIPTANNAPYGIVAGPDGNLWFARVNKIGRITPSGTVTEYPTPTANSASYGIAAGPDGNIWFTEFAASKIGKLTPCSTSSSAQSSSSSSSSNLVVIDTSVACCLAGSKTGQCRQQLGASCQADETRYGDMAQCTAGCGTGSSSSSSSSSPVIVIDPAVACCSPSGQCRQQLGSSCPADETKYNTMAQCTAGCGAGSSSSSSASVSSAGFCGPVCGDRIIMEPEECDDGTRNSDVLLDACRTACVKAHCGDGVADNGEQCDDGAGNGNAGGGCRANCTTVSGGSSSSAAPGTHMACSNNRCVAVQGAGADECSSDAQCRGNNSSNSGTSSNSGNSSSNSNGIPQCGNGVYEPALGEMCDDGNIVSGDGCSSLCETGQTQLSSTSTSSSSSRPSSSRSSSSPVIVFDPVVTCCAPSGQCRQQLGSSCPADETKYNTMAQCQANCGANSSSSSSRSSSSSSSSISSINPVICPSDPCGESGKKLCEEQGRTCVRDTTSPDCIRCKGGYQCTGDECGDIGKKYCNALGKSCIANKQSPLCVSCIESLVCRGDECAQRGSKYCAESGKACVKTKDGICFECRPEPQSVCTKNECEAGGRDYCALFGKSCAPTSGGMCIACVESSILSTLSSPSSALPVGPVVVKGCVSSIECAEGAQCDGGRCVQLCGNGRLDPGETCDPSAGPGSGGGACTSNCLLKQKQKCTHDTECGSRLCVKNACVPCTADYQCQSKDCRKGACANLCGNGRIDPGEACDPGIGGGENGCANNCLRSAGAECARNRDCQTGLCRDAPSGAEGTTEGPERSRGKVCDECSGGDQCYNGLCVSGACADLCGNGVVDPGEQCDDGNRVTGDGCSRFCERKSLAIGGAAPFRQLGEGAYRGDVRGMSGQYDEYGNFMPLADGAFRGDVRGMSGQYDEYGNFIPPVNGAYRGDVLGMNVQYDGYGRPLVAGHAAAGKTGPAALMAIAGGAAAGWAWIRRKRRADR